MLTIQEVYEQYYDRLLRYGYSIERDLDLVHDTIQDLFVWFMMNPDKLEKVQNLDVYLLKCLRRNLGSAMKQMKNKETRAALYMREEIRKTSSVEAHMIASEQEQEDSTWLQAQLRRLSPDQREVIFLRFYENLSYDEIAEIRAVSKQVVRNMVFRALKNLRRIGKRKNQQPLKEIYGLLSLFF
ncbi:MAG: sigma-70 family RNA polymerase sigma factor [Bacteroidota bacterium]